MANTQTVPFSFGDIELSAVVYIDGVPHATRLAVGEWLEYDDPYEGVRKLLNRNPYIEEFSVPVKLTGTDGKNYDQRIYHPIAFMLIVMESGQPKAQTFKRAVAEFVWNYAGPKQLTHKEELQLRNQALNVLAKLDRTSNPFVIQSLVSNLKTVCLRLGEPLPDIVLLNDPAKGQSSLPGV